MASPDTLTNDCMTGDDNIFINIAKAVTKCYAMPTVTGIARAWCQCRLFMNKN